MHYNVTSTKNDVYVTTDVSKFGSTNISDYNLQCSTVTADGYKKRLIYNESFDLFPPIDEAYGGSATTYWCDYNYTNNSTSDRTLIVGGCAGNGAHSGLLCLSSDSTLGHASATVGTRLIYIP